MQPTQETTQDLIFFNQETTNDTLSINLIQLLMQSWEPETFSKLVCWELFWHLFISRNESLLVELHEQYQIGLNHVFDKLSNTPEIDPQCDQVQFFLSNCLSKLPFFSKLEQPIYYPQYIEGKWVQVTYNIVPIELTATSGFEKLFISDNDRVYAYGLEPEGKFSTAERHLLFLGTTYPTGQGFITQINTDLEAFETAGNKIYKSGLQRILDWIELKPGNKPHVHGLSLGGALSLMLAIEHGDKLSRVDALNPPGLYNYTFNNHNDKWDELKSKPPVYIQKQGNDPVSAFGVWKEDFKVYQILPTVKPTYGLGDHNGCYVGSKSTRIIPVNPITDNQERTWRNRCIYVGFRAFISYIFVLPVHYFIRPAILYIWNYKIQLALISLLVAAAVLFPPVPLIACGALLGLAALIAAYCLIESIFKAIALYQGNVTPPRHPESPYRPHSIDLLRENSCLVQPDTAILVSSN